jgi:AraC-like DNA-binding protein
MQPTPEEALGITVPRVLQGALARRVVDQLTASERLLQASGALATPYAGDRARALVAELATAPEFTAASGRSEAEQAIQQAEADARSRFRDPLYDVSSMASTCGWERGYFTRRYKELRDDTPGAYIAGLRLDAGRYNLLEPEQTVAAVSESCGYASSNGFIRAFRRRFGQTPQRWREGQSEF